MSIQLGGPEQFEPGVAYVEVPRWTIAMPACEGWYWARTDYHNGFWSDPICVRVRRLYGKLIVETYKEDEGGEGDSMKTFRSRDGLNICQFHEWAGPLQPPV